MPVERIHANPLVQADVGMICLRRGPLLYCVEQVDHPEAAIGLLRLPRDAELRPVVREDLFDGIVTIVADACEMRSDVPDLPLYSTRRFDVHPAAVTAIPYFLWNNRGPNRMQVWLPEM
jgi:DUF1680 family protein